MRLTALSDMGYIAGMEEKISKSKICVVLASGDFVTFKPQTMQVCVEDEKLVMRDKNKVRIAEFLLWACWYVEEVIELP